MSDETKEKKPKKGKKGLVYGKASSTLTLKDGRTYTLGSSCDDMSADEQKKYEHSIRPKRKGEK